MKKSLIALFAVTLAGCTTLQSLYQGDFASEAECLATLDAELAEKELSEDLTSKIRDRIANQCENWEDFRDLAAVRKAVEAETASE